MEFASTYPSGIDWVKHIVDQLDDEMRCHLLPTKPFTLNGWTAAMIRDASTVRNSPDAPNVERWRWWIRSVEIIEMRNRSNLGYLLRALMIAIAEEQADYADLIGKYLVNEWEVTAADYQEYLVSKDRVAWIRRKAHHERGPNTLERDPNRKE